MWPSHMTERGHSHGRRDAREFRAVPADGSTSAGTTTATASSPSDAAPAAGAPADGYARGARILSIGIASTGVFTFAYFAVASHVLSSSDYGAISLLWSVLFVVISIIYRP